MTDRPHPGALKVPARYVVHHNVRGNGRWEVHPKDSPYCELRHPGWNPLVSGGGCLGLSIPRGRWSDAVTIAHRRSSEARLAFRDQLQARGRDFQ